MYRRQCLISKVKVLSLFLPEKQAIQMHYSLLADHFTKHIEPRKQIGIYIWNLIFNHRLLSWATSFTGLDLFVIIS